MSCRWRAQKKVLGVYIGNFETYTRYSEVADEKMSSGAIAFLNSLKGAVKKRVQETFV